MAGGSNEQDRSSEDDSDSDSSERADCLLMKEIEEMLTNVDVDELLEFEEEEDGEEDHEKNDEEERNSNDNDAKTKKNHEEGENKKTDGRIQQKTMPEESNKEKEDTESFSFLYDDLDNMVRHLDDVKEEIEDEEKYLYGSPSPKNERSVETKKDDINEEDRYLYGEESNSTEVVSIPENENRLSSHTGEYQVTNDSNTTVVTTKTTRSSTIVVHTFDSIVDLTEEDHERVIKVERVEEIPLVVVDDEDVSTKAQMRSKRGINKGNSNSWDHPSTSRDVLNGPQDSPEEGEILEGEILDSRGSGYEDTKNIFNAGNNRELQLMARNMNGTLLQLMISQQRQEKRYQEILKVMSHYGKAVKKSRKPNKKLEHQMEAIYKKLKKLQRKLKKKEKTDKDSNKNIHSGSDTKPVFPKVELETSTNAIPSESPIVSGVEPTSTSEAILRPSSTQKSSSNSLEQNKDLILYKTSKNKSRYSKQRPRSNSSVRVRSYSRSRSRSRIRSDSRTRSRSRTPYRSRSRARSRLRTRTRSRSISKRRISRQKYRSDYKRRSYSRSCSSSSSHLSFRSHSSSRSSRRRSRYNSYQRNSSSRSRSNSRGRSYPGNINRKIKRYSRSRSRSRSKSSRRYREKRSWAPQKTVFVSSSSDSDSTSQRLSTHAKSQCFASSSVSSGSASYTTTVRQQQEVRTGIRVIKQETTVTTQTIESRSYEKKLQDFRDECSLMRTLRTSAGNFIDIQVYDQLNNNVTTSRPVGNLHHALYIHPEDVELYRARLEKNVQPLQALHEICKKSDWKLPTYYNEMLENKQFKFSMCLNGYFITTRKTAPQKKMAQGELAKVFLMWAGVIS